MKKLAFVIVLVCASGLGNVRAAQNPDSTPELDPKDKLVVESVLRLKDFDIESSARAKAANVAISGA